MDSQKQLFYPPTKRPFVVLDTETTGLNPQISELLSIAIVDPNGNVLLDIYLTPEHNTEWEDAEAIHGITPEFIFSGNFPKLVDIKQQVVDILRNKDVVIYNASFDCGFINDILTEASAEAYDVMEPFAELYSDWSDYWQSNKWQKLTTAASCVLHEWKADAHSAVGDCFATLDVWRFLTEVDFRETIEEKKRKAQEARQIENAIESLLWSEERKKTKEWNEVYNRSDAGIKAFLTIWDWVGEYRVLDSAKASAHVFCQHLTGYSLVDWERYGEYRLNLPRILKVEKPNHLYLAADICYLKAGDDHPEPVLMMNRKKKVLDLVGLYDISQLVEGIDFVFWSAGSWPEGCFSETSLKKQFKLKPKQIRELKPAYMRIGYKFNYLLYRYQSEGKASQPADAVIG